MIDVLFITSNNSNGIYQELSNKYSAIETPTWSLLLAQSCRSQNYKVAILDCLAENLTDEESYIRIKKLNPKLLCFVVYGQNVNAGTTNMSGATRLAKFLKHKDKIRRVTLWGVTDKQSWKNDFPVKGRTDYPLLFDRKDQEKPVVQKIIKLAEKN